MSGKVPIDKMMPSALPEEVVDFENFLQQTGGRQGGWDDYDHQNFVKVRNKHKGKPTFMGEVLENLPARTQDEVQQHEKWYQKFLALEERKKEVRIITRAVICCRFLSSRHWAKSTLTLQPFWEVCLWSPPHIVVYKRETEAVRS